MNQGAKLPTYQDPTRNIGGTTGSNLASAASALGRAYSSFSSSAGSSGGGNAASGLGSSLNNMGTYGVADTPTPPPQMSSYKGRTGVDTFSSPSSYSSQGTTLSGLSNQNNINSAKTRIDNQNRIQGQIADATAQYEALVAKRKEEQAARQVADQAAGIITEDEDEYYKDPEIRTLESQLSALQNELAGAQSQTEEEIGYEKQLRDLLASKEMGLQEVAEQPIPMSFIAGQQSAIEKRAANKAIPLQNQLATLQARRAAASDAAKVKSALISDKLGRVSDYKKDRRREQFDLEQAQAEAQAQASKPFTISEGQRIFDPVTGKVIYSAPKSYAPQAPKNAPTQVVDVGGRKKLINAQTGAVISDLGPSSSSGREI